MQLQPDGPERLRRLARPGPGHGPEQANGLHGQRGGSRNDPAALRVVPSGPRDGGQVHAVVMEETPVLGGQHGLDQLGVHVRQADVPAADTVGCAGLTQRQAAAVLDAGHRRGWRRHVPGQRQSQPDAQGKGPEGGCNGGPECPPAQAVTRHGFACSTRKMPPALRPLTPGLYISSAWAGG